MTFLRSTQLTKLPIEPPSKLKDSFQPRSCQVTMKNAAISQNKGLWQADCGVGKSRAALMAIVARRASLALILTVRSALNGVWAEEIEDTVENARYLILNKGNSKTKTNRMLTFTAEAERDGVLGIVVVNYETARLLPLDAIRWDIAIADESHRLGGHSSKISRELARLCRNIPIKIAMTGTPYSDRPLSLYGQMRWLNPTRSGSHWLSADFGRWEDFFNQYTTYYLKDGIKIPTGYKNLDVLAEKISKYTTIIKAEDVLDLPPVTEIIRYVDLSPKHRKTYDELYKDMVTYPNGEMVLAQNPLVLATRLHQLTGGFYQPYDVRKNTQQIEDGTAKLDELLELLDQIGNKPVVVFTRFRDDVQLITAALRKMGVTYRELTGEKDQHKEWKEGAAQVLVANIKAGGTGINLGRANYVIYYSTGYSRTDFDQSRDRVIPRTNKPVFIYYILARRTIDEIIFKVLKSKGEVSEQIKELLDGRESSE